MKTNEKNDSRRLIGLAVIVTLKLLIFFLLGRTETLSFVYAGF